MESRGRSRATVLVFATPTTPSSPASDARLEEFEREKERFEDRTRAWRGDRDDCGRGA